MRPWKLAGAVFVLWAVAAAPDLAPAAEAQGVPPSGAAAAVSGCGGCGTLRA
jgi:hypothetical protein